MLTSDEFKVDDMLDQVRDARAFYDGQHGLRMIVVTPNYWGETWIRSPTSRRASVHTAFLEHGVVLEYDTQSKDLRVVKTENWPDEWLQPFWDMQNMSLQNSDTDRIRTCEDTESSAS